MTIKKIIPILSLLSFFSWFTACVEPYEIKTEDFESALIIEATITDELIQQQINLKRTFPLEEDGPNPETGADVRVIDDLQNEYIFTETEPGNYISNLQFRAHSERSYQLEIQTQDGRSYASNPTELAGKTEIENIEPKRITNDDDKDGIGLFLESSRTSNGSGYYRYEYEETFKIVSPFSIPFDLIVENNEVLTVPKEKEETVCYRTEKSQDILLANTNELTENWVNGFLVNFVEKGEPKLNHRYSLLVKQFTLSREAYVFYQTLNELSDSSNLFSQTQPGFLNGNVFSVDSEDEKVLGYFDVSSVSTKRIFFSFSEFFEDKERGPSFVNYCPVQIRTASEAKEYIISGALKYIGRDGLSYRMVRSPCVDCTLSGTNKVPDFWEE